MPVFIKMIYTQPDDVIDLYGFEYKMVTVVAIVRNIEHTSTKITYSMEDITGNKKFTFVSVDNILWFQIML